MTDLDEQITIQDWRAALPRHADLAHGNGAVRVTVPLDVLSETVHQLTTTARLADMFASPGQDGPGGDLVLSLVWAVEDGHRYLVCQTPVSPGEYPSLSDIAPAAFVEECEIYEQFGLRPAGGKPLDRITVPPQAGTEFPRLGQAPADEPREVHAPHVVGGQAFEFPFGPVRAAGFESLYYGLVTSGEEVVDLYMFTWHKHRGIEYRLRGQHPRQALFFVERAEGFSAIAHGWAFASAVERALRITISPAATQIRATALEMERIYNHTAAIVALCQSTGLSVGQAGAEIALERLLRLNTAVFGHRYLFGVVDIGGVAHPVDLDLLRAELPAVRAELRRVTEALNTTNSYLDRLEATGIVTTERAGQLGLVGPVARASGVDLDTRRDHGDAPYDTHPVQVACRNTGDALARYQVLLAEIEESTRLIDELSRPSHPFSAPAAVPTRAGAGLGWAESARGEALVWVDLDEQGQINRARLRPAAVRNWRAFGDAARSQNVFTDIPIIEASFWLTVAGRAR